jgi:hypothetical protein
MNLPDVIRATRVIVHPDPHMVCLGGVVPDGDPDVFAVFREAAETTVVAKVSRVSSIQPLRTEGPFTLIEFQMPTPFQAPGFLARICGLLAARRINVLVYSTYSRDYVLVPTSDLADSLEALRRGGFGLS